MKHDYTYNIPEEILSAASVAIENGDVRSFQKIVNEQPAYADQLNEMIKIWDDLEDVKVPKASAGMDAQFYKMLNDQTVNVPKQTGIWKSLTNLLKDMRTWVVLAAILVGFALGKINKNASIDPPVETQKVVPNASIIFASNPAKVSAFDRLEEIQKSRELEEPSMVIIEALHKAMLYDNNVNVRLSALETMVIFADHPKVREYLIKSIPFQDSPIVLIELAELMSALQEKQSSDEWQEVLKNERTESDVKFQLEEKLTEIL